jgi:GGDEF domain-containing protein
VAVREAGQRSHRGDADGPDRKLRALRARWRTASIATGWRFPSDWALPEVDEVCSTVLRAGRADLRGADLTEALTGLGKARAEAGVGLDETLKDLAALHAVLSGAPDGLLVADPDATPSPLLRTVALAWAEVTMGEFGNHEATEALTGLATADYLRTRLGEIYRRGTRTDCCPSSDHVLLAVVMDLTEVTGWSRLMAMVVVADVLRVVFDGGESVAMLGQSVAAVLSERDDGLAARAAEARFLLAERLAVDPQLRNTPRPQMRTYRLPASHRSAVELVTQLAKA